MRIKKIMFGAPIIILAIIFVAENPLTFGFCKNIAEWMGGIKYCADESILPKDVGQLGVFLSLSLLPLSLLTYRMRDEAFRAWWNPARWWIPVIILATLITSVIDSQSGSHVGDFPSSIPVLGTLYTIFIITSLWKIIRAYREGK